MTTKAGRNDPCPCGSGKKYKACCWMKQNSGKKKFSAKVLSGISQQASQMIPKPATQDLMDKRYGDMKKEHEKEHDHGDHSHCGDECQGHHH